MARGPQIKHVRKAGAFIDGELASGEWGLDVSSDTWYYSSNGTTVVALVTGGAGATALGGLTDVTLTVAANDNLLAYDTASGAWTNQTAANAGLAAAAHGHVAADVSDFQSAVTANPTVAGAIQSTEKGTANGVATLGSDLKVPSAQLPPLALTNVSTVASQAAQLALTAEEGDVAIRTDTGTTYIHNGGVAGTMADWSTIEAPTAVSSVFGRAGAVVATAADYAASQITNDSGVAGAFVHNALNTLDTGKAAASHTHAAGDIVSGDLATARMQTNVAAALNASGAATISNALLIIDAGTI
jgi:hypothetical protein